MKAKKYPVRIYVYQSLVFVVAVIFNRWGGGGGGRVNIWQEDCIHKFDVSIISNILQCTFSIW